MSDLYCDRARGYVFEPCSFSALVYFFHELSDEVRSFAEGATHSKLLEVTAIYIHALYYSMEKGFILPHIPGDNPLQKGSRLWYNATMSKDYFREEYVIPPGAQKVLVEVDNGQVAVEFIDESVDTGEDIYDDETE